MRITTRPPTTNANPTWRRLAWFAALWLAGVLTMGAVASLMRWALHP